MRQFVVVRFKDTDTRTYTYHNDGQPVQSGDQVKIEDRHGNGWSSATVVSVGHEKPSFDTKPIMGLAPALPSDQGAADVHQG